MTCQQDAKCLLKCVLISTLLYRAAAVCLDVPHTLTLPVSASAISRLAVAGDEAVGMLADVFHMVSRFGNLRALP